MPLAPVELVRDHVLLSRRFKMMPDDFMKKNMEMWERFSSTAMDNMFKAMEKTMEQSQAFQERMDKAAAKAVSSQLEATLSTLQAIQRQVEALSAKMDQYMEKED